MIEILKPILKKNKIIYNIIIDKKKYKFQTTYTNYNGKINDNIDGIVIMMTPIAICNNWTIKSKYPIDSQLYSNLINLVEIYKKYHHKHTYLLKHITKEQINLILDIPTIDRKNINDKVIGTISMGIDSLYTLLAYKDDINTLIYVNNLDRSNKIKDFNKYYENISLEYNKTLIVAESNFKEIMSKLNVHGTNYGVFTCDSIIMSLCYPLNIKKIYFSGCSETPCLNGQHWEITKNFNSNEFISVQNKNMRIQKLKYILEKDEKLLNRLRVCNGDSNFFLNCSNCGKCRGTLLYLYMLGYYDKAITFDRPNINYVDYYLTEIYTLPDKLLNAKYIDDIIFNIINIYKEGNIQNIDKYYSIFENDVNYIKEF